MTLSVRINIELVHFENSNAPVVFEEKVYQLCFSDWDGDCILKDDINGVRVLSNMFTDDEMYDDELLEVLENHPFKKVTQIKCNNEIICGSTLQLQALIDLYYKKSYI
jgi:hypothetical protein